MDQTQPAPLRCGAPSIAGGYARRSDRETSAVCCAASVRANVGKWSSRLARPSHRTHAWEITTNSVKHAAHADRTEVVLRGVYPRQCREVVLPSCAAFPPNACRVKSPPAL